MSRKFVYGELIKPKEIIGTVKQFKAGDGVQIRDGKLIATQSGRLVIEEETNKVDVVPLVAGG